MASSTIPTTPSQRRQEHGAGAPSPPSLRGNGNGGNGGNGFGPRRGQLPVSNAVLGMGVLLCSLTMLFTGLMSAYVVLRATAGSNWPPAGVPMLPSGLWVSTLILLASSATLGWGQRAVRRGNQSATKFALMMTTLLGFAFLAFQTYLWHDVFLEGLTQRSQYGSLFFTLTGIHAAHVIGGLVILCWVSLGGLVGRYTSHQHEAVTLVAMYWHFLAIIWIVLFTALYLVH